MSQLDDRAASCEHQHWLWDPGFARRQIGHHFRTVRAVTASKAPVRPAYHGDGLVLEPGSVLRLEAAMAAADACSDAFFGIFRCRVLSGAQAGACIELGGEPTLSPLDPAMFERGWRGPGGFVQLD